MSSREWNWKELSVHTAKCDRCDKHNESTMFRCDSCTLQICAACEKLEPPAGHQHAVSNRRRRDQRLLSSIHRYASSEHLDDQLCPTSMKRRANQSAPDSDNELDELVIQRRSRKRKRKTVVTDDDDANDLLPTSPQRRLKKGKAPLHQNISIRKTRAVTKVVSNNSSLWKS